MAWNSYHEPDGVDDEEIWVKRYTIDGTTLYATSPERVNIFYDYDQEIASLDMNEAGDILVSWTDLKQEKTETTDNDYGVYARLFPEEQPTNP